MTRGIFEMVFSTANSFLLQSTKEIENKIDALLWAARRSLPNHGDYHQRRGYFCHKKHPRMVVKDQSKPPHQFEKTETLKVEYGNDKWMFTIGGVSRTKQPDVLQSFVKSPKKNRS